MYCLVVAFGVNVTIVIRLYYSELQQQSPKRLQTNFFPYSSRNILKNLNYTNILCVFVCMHVHVCALFIKHLSLLVSDNYFFLKLVACRINIKKILFKKMYHSGIVLKDLTSHPKLMFYWPWYDGIVLILTLEFYLWPKKSHTSARIRFKILKCHILLVAISNFFSNICYICKIHFCHIF